MSVDWIVVVAAPVLMWKSTWRGRLISLGIIRLIDKTSRAQ